jgi:uncharacterized membrane protein YqjE
MENKYFMFEKYLKRILFGEQVSRSETILAIIFGGMFFGAVMGSYSFFSTFMLASPKQVEATFFLQSFYSAVKVPILILVSALLAVPSFYVFHALLGLHEDFGKAIKAVLSTQSAVAIILASLSPIVIICYLGTPTYRQVVLVNSVMFAIASISAQWVLRRRYRHLILENRRHLWTMWLWMSLYSFVGIQMGWVLRPFIGDPNSPTTFIRQEAWGNAYVVIFNMIFGK